MTSIEQGHGSTNFDTRVGSEQKSNGLENANASTSTRSSDEKGPLSKIANHHYIRACWDFMTWTPTRCRWDPESPPKFSLGLNVLFGFVSILLFLIAFHIHILSGFSGPYFA
jgi:hypothetical protein